MFKENKERIENRMKRIFYSEKVIEPKTLFWISLLIKISIKSI